jgi:type IV pilus assembly protein PilM
MVFNGTVRIAASLCGLVYERIPSTGNRSAEFFRELSLGGRRQKGRRKSSLRSLRREVRPEHSEIESQNTRIGNPARTGLFAAPLVGFSPMRRSEPFGRRRASAQVDQNGDSAIADDGDFGTIVTSNDVRRARASLRRHRSMAKSKGVWGVDIGQCALKAVKLSFDAKEDKAVLEAFDFVEHPKILSQPDADPDELVRSALEQFLSRNDVDEDLVYLSVPGQAGLARVVKLPPVESKKVPDIVRFEANQQIPFKLDDVSWDYQLLGSGEETAGYVVDAEVGIFAIKKENVAKHLAPLERFGVEVGVVQLAPVALYNFAAFDQFLHATQKIESPTTAAADEAPQQEEEGDTVVILDIGADNTDLVVTNGDKIWMRNLPIGGNHFTRALSKEMKLTFAKAEHMKRNATKAPDPKKLYQAMRPVFQDFANELQKSLGFFSTTNRQAVIRKVLGVGNGFKLPGLQKFLQQHLQYPVDRVVGFHGLRGDALAEPVFLENTATFCIAYGLALQGLKQTPVQTNLLPKEVRTKRMIRDKKPWTLGAAAAVLAGFSAMFFGSFRAYSAVKDKGLESAQKSADGAVADFRKLQSDYDGAKSGYKKAFEDGVNNLGLKAAEKRLQWIQILKTLNETMPARLPSGDGTPLEEVPELNVDHLNGSFLTNVGDWYSKAFEGEEGAKAKNTLSDEDKASGPSGEGWVFQALGYTYNKESLLFVQNTLLKKLQSKSMRDKGLTHACLYWYDRNMKWSPKVGSSSEKRPRIYELLKTGFGSGGAATAGGGGMRGGGLEGGLSSGGLMGFGGGVTSSGGGRGDSSGQMVGGGPSNFGSGSGYGGAMGGSEASMSGGRGGRGGGGMASMMGGMEGAGMSGGMDEFFMPGGFLGGESGFPGADKAPEKTIERTDFEIHIVWTPKKPDDQGGEKK